MFCKHYVQLSLSQDICNTQKETFPVWQCMYIKNENDGLPLPKIQANRPIIFKIKALLHCALSVKFQWFITLGRSLFVCSMTNTISNRPCTTWNLEDPFVNAMVKLKSITVFFCMNCWKKTNVYIISGYLLNIFVRLFLSEDKGWTTFYVLVPV